MRSAFPTKIEDEEWNNKVCNCAGYHLSAK